MATQRKRNFQRAADFFARGAHEENFSSRRGAFIMTGYDGEDLSLVLYSNNPWSGGAAEEAELREWVEAAGITIRATGHAGKTDEGEPYTTCWLLDSPEREDDVVAAWREIIDRLYSSPHPHLRVVQGAKGGA
jgi:hypothetical protein